ncbi:MAG: ATP-dependent DNA helicase RecG [Fervidobacterium sp.]|nr:ATP-dependent DNA helicase RecG [Fervidobacterium sp.]
MLLIEEFLDTCYQIANQSNETSINELIEYVEDNFENIDDPLMADPEIRTKLQEFFEYITFAKKLPSERAFKRLQQVRGMVERFKYNYLISSIKCLEQPKSLDTPIKYAKGVGPSREKLLKKLGINTIGDLINYFPRDYEDRRKIIPLAFIKENEKITTKGVIKSVEKAKKGELLIITALLQDGISQILLKWFNQEFKETEIKQLVGKEVYVTGTPKRGFFGAMEIQNPEIAVNESSEREILPVYPLTENLTQKTLRKIIQDNLLVVCNCEDIIPQEIVNLRRLIDIKSAYVGIHFPKSSFHQKSARKRLAYEELLLFQLALFLSKRNIEKIGGIQKNFSGKLAEKFLETLPFKLTNAQLRAHEEIRKDLRSSNPMNRLLQGDVGSGKTLVAELAIIDNYEAGYQSALMVPTSILAIQHYQKIFNHLTNLGINVALLIGSTSQKEKDKIKFLLKNGEIDVIIGTHALIQEDVHFSNLGLVIIDEQHRFGVKQREELISKGKVVDTLIMTATPIPRTLSLTLYGDLDVSVIDEMPPGRKQIKTFTLRHTRVKDVYKFIREQVIENSDQAYIVYPLIEQSDQINAKAAEEMYKTLSKEAFPDIPMGLLHGKMSDIEKNEIMTKFVKGEIKILVSTSVIEVGVDVPNATIMVVENAERFGLAQLHQLRGRVGRGEKQSYCFLIVSEAGEEAWERLQFFASTNDGFKIAEYDLRLRGPGEFFGTRQHGLPEFKVADLVSDAELIMLAREDAKSIIENYPESVIINKVLEIYSERIKLLDVG